MEPGCHSKTTQFPSVRWVCLGGCGRVCVLGNWFRHDWLRSSPKCRQHSGSALKRRHPSHRRHPRHHRPRSGIRLHFVSIWIFCHDNDNGNDNDECLQKNSAGKTKGTGFECVLNVYWATFVRGLPCFGFELWLILFACGVLWRWILAHRKRHCRLAIVNLIRFPAGLLRDGMCLCLRLSSIPMSVAMSVQKECRSYSG